MSGEFQKLSYAIWKKVTGVKFDNFKYFLLCEHILVFQLAPAQRLTPFDESSEIRKRCDEQVEEMVDRIKQVCR